MKGIDVSKYQGNIDWNKVKASGIDFVIIRVGYGKSSVDPNFVKYIKGASAAGLKIGVYWFIYATSKQAVIQNANTFNKTIAPYKDLITMKVWSDWEYDSDNYCQKHGIVLGKTARTEWVKLFCNTMINYGWDCGIYTNLDYKNNKFGDISEYPLWMAYYSSKQYSNCYMQQYSSKGSVPGISGNVDMNICYEESSTSPATQKKNPYSVPTRTLKKKVITMRGEDVKWLQWELVEKGFLAATNKKGKSNIDGAFGKLTDAAVRAYQAANGLVVDGSVGKITRTHILNS